MANKAQGSMVCECDPKLIELCQRYINNPCLERQRGLEKYLEKDYASKKTLMAEYDCSASLVNKIISEMRQLAMYDGFAITDTGFLRIERKAFDHYLRNRHRIRNGLFYEPWKGE